MVAHEAEGEGILFGGLIALHEATAPAQHVGTDSLWVLHTGLPGSSGCAWTSPAHVGSAPCARIGHCAALREQLYGYCDVPDPLVVRVHVYGPKGDVRLASFTVRTGGGGHTEPELLPAAAVSRPQALEMTNIEDVVTQRVMWTMKLSHDHTASVHSNYQKIFDVMERLLTRVAGLMEQRATRAERHVLDVLDKRIADKRVELDLTENSRKKEGEVQVKEKAIETAGSVVEKLLGGVLGAFGVEPGTIGQLGGLVTILEGDPELKSMISDPATVNALRNPEFRSVMKSMFTSLKTGTIDGSDAAEATPEV
jgi:hypothetical protein